MPMLYIINSLYNSLAKLDHVFERKRPLTEYLLIQILMVVLFLLNELHKIIKDIKIKYDLEGQGHRN